MDLQIKRVTPMAEDVIEGGGGCGCGGSCLSACCCSTGGN